MLVMLRLLAGSLSCKHQANVACLTAFSLFISADGHTGMWYPSNLTGSIFFKFGAEGGPGALSSCLYNCSLLVYNITAPGDLENGAQASRFMSANETVLRVGVIFTVSLLATTVIPGPFGSKLDIDVQQN